MPFDHFDFMRSAYAGAPKAVALWHDKLRSLSNISALLALCAAALTTTAAIAAQATVPDTIAQRALACAACHGKEGRATSEGFFPRIAGKSAAYLNNQLLNFREGRRQYPMMTYMVGHLSDTYLMELAQYFADQHLPYPAPQAATVSAATLEQGRILVTSGDASRKIPACISCHGQQLTGALPAIPSLVGLPRDYLNSQFGAWQSGTRKAAAPDCMAQISRQLRPDEIAAVSAWLASQTVPADMRPAATLPKMPMPCGSAPQRAATIGTSP